MNLGYFNRSTEANARAYCISIGADPDELVNGYARDIRPRLWISAPRWQWYLGVSDAALARPI